MARLSSLLIAAVMSLPSWSLDSLAIRAADQGDIDIRATSVEVTNVTPLNLARAPGTGISVPMDTDERRYSDSVIGGVLVANTAIATAIATCVAATAGWGIWPCIGIGAAAVTLNYLTIWLHGTPAAILRHNPEAGGSVKVQIHGPWRSVDGCDTACVFVANAPPNIWTPLGNTTYPDGTLVHIHALHDGKEGGVRGLRAVVPSSAGGRASGDFARRQIEDDYNSVTTQFYFRQENQTAVDSFIADYDGNATNLANAVGRTISDFAAGMGASAMCGNFYDDDGFVTDGVWTFDYGDQYNRLDNMTVESNLDGCVTIG